MRIDQSLDLPSFLASFCGSGCFQMDLSPPSVPPVRIWTLRDEEDRELPMSLVLIPLSLRLFGPEFDLHLRGCALPTSFMFISLGPFFFSLSGIVWKCRSARWMIDARLSSLNPFLDPVLDPDTLIQHKESHSCYRKFLLFFSLAFFPVSPSQIF